MSRLLICVLLFLAISNALKFPDREEVFTRERKLLDGCMLGIDLHKDPPKEAPTKLYDAWTSQIEEKRFEACKRYVSALHGMIETNAKAILPKQPKQPQATSSTFNYVLIGIIVGLAGGLFVYQKNLTPEILRALKERNIL